MREIETDHKVLWLVILRCFWEEFWESAQNSFCEHLNELITIFEKFIQETNLMCVLGVGLVYN